ncbi:hypothetical protein Enr17x_18620 [Gimesia fumaroli]|uniref:Uncharacterized protein n=1 Tax=Gimesia fumaroli TaxID=2527976 RepID=A0A518I9Q5_9PLAN|nr:hypothetical protein Enr17x_18620 [Gimesia fumaroli]
MKLHHSAGPPERIRVAFFIHNEGIGRRQASNAITGVTSIQNQSDFEPAFRLNLADRFRKSLVRNPARKRSVTPTALINQTKNLAWVRVMHEQTNVFAKSVSGFARMRNIDPTGIESI